MNYSIGLLASVASSHNKIKLFQFGENHPHKRVDDESI